MTELKDIGLMYLSGLSIVSFLSIIFSLLTFYIDFFIVFMYPIGYALLILCLLMFIPIGCGMINVLCKHYLLDSDEDKISLSFWYYGFFFMLVYLSFRTLLMYMPSLVLIITTFTVIAFICGVLVKIV